jgi:hypothetical protein
MFMWSIYLEELSFIHVVNVNHMIMFFLYQYCPLYIVNSNHIINFHSCVTISSISFNFNHVVNFIQVTRFNPMIQFYSCDQVHPNGHPKFTWISYVYQISFMAISYWHQCHPYEKKWFSVNSIQFPLFTKWTIFFPLFHHGQCQWFFLGFFIHSQSGNHP